MAKYRSLEVSTPWAYKTYRQQFRSTYIQDRESLAARAEAVHSSNMVKGILHKDTKEIVQQLHNDLEKVVLPEFPIVLELRETLTNAGVLGAMMSGSGPSVFAICESKQQAEEVKSHVRKKIPDQELELFVAQLIAHGIQLAP